MGDTKKFSVEIELHQESDLSPFFFTKILDTITNDIQDEVPWVMLFADDIMLVGKMNKEVNRKLEIWRHNLESNGLRLSR